MQCDTTTFSYLNINGSLSKYAALSHRWCSVGVWKRKVIGKLRSQSVWEQVEKLEEMQWSTVRQKDASETEGEGIQNSDQASNANTGQKRGLQRRDKKNGLR